MAQEKKKNKNKGANIDDKTTFSKYSKIKQTKGSTGSRKEDISVITLVWVYIGHPSSPLLRQSHKIYYLFIFMTHVPLG